MNIAIGEDTKNNFESIYDLDNPAQFLFVFEKVINFYKKRILLGFLKDQREQIKVLKI